ncbi:MAG: T9SS type A sorting domain-containing protein [Flavobacteriales bacterium]|nr:T9SS type A sorting domain-containing protein [Flavobacteriales bacterium]
MRERLLLSTLAFSLSTMAALAQLPLVDITLVSVSATELEVRVRPDANFEQLFSSVVFTVRWTTASGASLGPESQDPPADDYITINKSGSESDDAGYRYQIFAGLGFTTIFDAGGTWVAGQEHTIATIPVVGGTDVFEIVNDAWTASNNGDFYVSLNGQEQQGVIYSSSTGMLTVGAEHGLTVRPNPTAGATEVVYTPKAVTDLTMVIVNAAGQEVWRRDRKGLQGTLREVVDLSRFGKGAYVLTATDAFGVTTRKILVQ